MDTNRNILLTPDATEGGGSALAQPTGSVPTSAGESQTGGAPKAPPATSGDGIDREKYQRALQAQAEASRIWNELGQHGIKSQDDLRRAAEAYARIRQVESDPRAKGVFDALVAKPAEPDPSTLPLTPQTIEQVVSRAFEKQTAAQQAAAAKAAQAAAARAEIENIDAEIASEQYRPILNGASFDDAQDGKAGPLAQAFALLVDRNVVAATTRPDGSRVFATDRRIVAEAMAKAHKDIAAIRAATVMGASRQNGSAAPNPFNPAPVEPERRNPYESRSSEKAAKAASIGETFRAAFVAAGGGQG